MAPDPARQSNRDDRVMIERAVERHGYTVRSWRDGEDGLEGVVGRFRVVDEDAEVGLYEDDEGDLVACVVGAAQYGNQRVHFSLRVDEYDSSYDVNDLDALEPADV